MLGPTIFFAATKKAVATGFMVVATLCATKQGVDTCLVQADTHLVQTRAQCVDKGKDLIKNATTAFGYARMPVPYRTKIYCAPKGSDPVKVQTTKPEATGTTDLPPPVIKVEPTTKPVPTPKTWTDWLWPF